MRTIKFRAFDTVFKYFVALEVGTTFNKRELCPKKRIELTQFTGLLDKNGKEIYEGDIVKTSQGNRAVEWLSVGWSLLLRDESCEVIGNIYENLELLSPVI